MPWRSRPTASTPPADGPTRSLSTTWPPAQLVTRLTDPGLVKLGPVPEPGRGASGSGAVAGLQPRRQSAGLGQLSRSEALAAAAQRAPRRIGRRHRGDGAVAVSPDGKWAATGEASGADQAVGHWQRSKIPRRWPAIRPPSPACSSCPTARSWSRARSTRRCACGTWPTARRWRSWKRPRRSTPWRSWPIGRNWPPAVRDNVIRLWTLPAEAGGAIAAGRRDLAGHARPGHGPGRVAQRQDAARLGQRRRHGSPVEPGREASRSAQINHGAAVTALGRACRRAASSPRPAPTT